MVRAVCDSPKYQNPGVHSRLEALASETLVGPRFTDHRVHDLASVFEKLLLLVTTETPTADASPLRVTGVIRVMKFALTVA